MLRFCNYLPRLHAECNGYPYIATPQLYRVHDTICITNMSRGLDSISVFVYSETCPRRNAHKFPRSVFVLISPVGFLYRRHAWPQGWTVRRIYLLLYPPLRTHLSLCCRPAAALLFHAVSLRLLTFLAASSLLRLGLETTLPQCATFQMAANAHLQIQHQAVVNVKDYFAATANSRSRDVLHGRRLLASVLFSTKHLPASQFPDVDVAAAFNVHRKLVSRGRRHALSTPDLILLSKPKVFSTDISLHPFVLSSSIFWNDPVLPAGSNSKA